LKELGYRNLTRREERVLTDPYKEEEKEKDGERGLFPFLPNSIREEKEFYE
jgi:hypothetical protein